MSELPMQASKPLPDLSCSIDYARMSAEYKVDAIYRAEHAARQALTKCETLQSENNRLERAIDHLRTIVAEQQTAIENMRAWAAKLKTGSKE